MQLAYQATGLQDHPPLKFGLPEDVLRGQD